ncbi:MAG: nuclear transport factor 2 family protein [Nitrospinae bacterium]|nr:nuclear transport factor 2 family protein [Nitrospinota bacterium]MBL7019351.1 nuclear transport factor 2 family protein [Nitrospinaceae bacterium]
MTKEADVEAAVSGFYEALNLLFTGDAEPMKDAWSHTDDSSYMGPDGLYLLGWEKIEAMWENVGALKLGGCVNPKQLNTVVGTDMALITCVESGGNEVAGQAEKVDIRSSTVFRKEGAAWKVVAHQTDLLSYLAG